MGKVKYFKKVKIFNKKLANHSITTKQGGWVVMIGWVAMQLKTHSNPLYIV
jgi:hypothetical protein